MNCKWCEGHFDSDENAEHGDECGSRREKVLESLGRKEGDVMEDEKGEYVLVQNLDYFDKLYLSDVEID